MVPHSPGITNQPPAQALAMILRVTRSLVESYGPSIPDFNTLGDFERSLGCSIDELEQIAACETDRVAHRP